MRQCIWVKKLLTAYTSGELRATAIYAIERHLKACPQCLREYQAEKQLEALLRLEGQELTRKSASPLTWREVHSSFQREEGDSASGRMYLADLWRVIFISNVKRVLSSAIYWGKRAALPATLVLALFVYMAYNHLYGTPKPGQLPLEEIEFQCIRISFGPGDSEIPRGWFKDSGKTYSSNAEPSTELRYGWRQGSLEKKGIAFNRS